MARVPQMELPFADWPEEDRKRWSDAIRSGADPFDDCGPAAHLAESSRRALQGSYGRFLGFVSTERNCLLECKPDVRVDRETVAEYVTWRRRACGDTAIAIDLHHLRLALGYICPSMEWSWLLTITKRLTTQAPRKHERRHQVTSEQLYALGIELMERAVTNSKEATHITKVDAFDYRDGLLIALLARIPLRRRTIATLRVGTHLVKSARFGHSTFQPRTISPSDRSNMRFCQICPSESIGTWRNSDAAFRERKCTRAFGHPTKANRWTTGQSMTWFGGGRVRPSDSRSIYIAFGLPREPFGQSTTPPTCAVSKTCLVMHHSIQRKDTTSWRSRASRDVRSLTR